MSEISEADLVAVQARSSGTSVTWLRGVAIGDGVDAGPGDQLMALGQEGGDDLPACVIGIGHEEDLLVPGPDQGEEETDHLVEERALVAVG